MNYGFLIDTHSCIGCHACSTACKSENEVPLGVYRTWVKTVEVGTFPDVKRSFQVTRCNHCANPPCVRICPTGAMHQRADGIVDFDSDACIGCKACIQACPYDAIHIDPSSHTAAKCNFCAHRTDLGLEPACVVVCPEHAIVAGDLDDAESEIRRLLARLDTVVRKPEQGTAPKVFYTQANETALHPTSRLPPATFAAAQVRPDPHGVQPGNPEPKAPRLSRDPRGTEVRLPDTQGLPGGGPVAVGGRMASQVMQVTYNAQHKTWWHWPIPAYLVTKHVAGGAFAWLALAALLPGGGFSSGLMVPVGALGILLTLVTLGFLVYDLDRPDRFFYLLVRPQWRSWVARAAWILTGFSALTTLWWGLEAGLWLELLPASLVEGARAPLALLSLPFSVLAATYTAFLFAQAEGRDLWQSPALPPQMALQAAALGAAPLLAFGGPSWLAPAMFAALVGSLLVTLVGDLAIALPSELARRAQHDLVWGHYRRHYWLGGVLFGHLLPLGLLAVGAPWAAAVAGLSCALGVFAWALGLVFAPQALPNS